MWARVHTDEMRFCNDALLSCNQLFPLVSLCWFVFRAYACMQGLGLPCARFRLCLGVAGIYATADATLALGFLQ